MRIMSSAFRNGELIPREYTRDAGDKSPPLHIEGVPLMAKSLVLIMDDPDAPRGTFTHWLVFDIDPKRVDIDEDQAPEEARQGKTGWGEDEYGGPKPPSGEHRYLFKLYALDKKLGLPQGSTRQQIEAAMKGHVLATAEFLGRYASAVAANVAR
jgi:Raf kinase inhibitor-like YbhB/YbcL family protein